MFLPSNVTYVSFISAAVNPELIQPKDTESPLSKLIRKGTTYYHVAYQTDDIELSVKYFIDKKAILIDMFDSEAFENKKCACLYTDVFHLIELIQA